MTRSYAIDEIAYLALEACRYELLPQGRTCRSSHLLSGATRRWLYPHFQFAKCISNSPSLLSLLPDVPHYRADMSDGAAHLSYHNDMGYFEIGIARMPACYRCTTISVSIRG